MPHLVLPHRHNDDDLALAAQVVDLLRCDTLYVTWSSIERSHAAPAVEAVVQDPPPPAAVAFLSAVVGRISSLFGARKPAPRA